MEQNKSDTDVEKDGLSEIERRRRFLQNCTKFATGAPPAIALLMSSSSSFAQSAGAGDCSGDDQQGDCG